MGGLPGRPRGDDAELPVALADKLLPSDCALLVIDMQNDFCAPGGYVDRVMGKDVTAAAGIVPALQEMVATARAAGVPVVWVCADYSHALAPDSMRVKLKARGIQTECCKPGTWGAEAFGVAPQPGEPVVFKHTYSGFIGTELASVLVRLGRRTLVFGGVQTQICVESTVRDAHSLGYFCVVPRDAVASHTQALHEGSLTNIQFLFGDVCAVSDVRAAWSGAPAAAA
ncbi:MAG: isochorismatase family cysteine hydrolase [Pigmentiphaga sp.]|uniref:cysteine hydrolase family protein n=1 Tax=Pigmentiphaga sp. TaxID=1977564 RepID=UPI0029AA48D2|nr:isochorismatase family cysteine hydrolase [Pigmentiphaga sp.]MDX3905904.1 isochorismatase family cysteine hydrolase [Pigmentiphaga sp.]